MTDEERGRMSPSELRRMRDDIRNEEAGERDKTQEQIERAMCLVWGVNFKRDGSHLDEIAAKRDRFERAAEAHESRSSIFKVLWVAFVTAIGGSIAGWLLAINWLHPK